MRRQISHHSAIIAVQRPRGPRSEPHPNHIEQQRVVHRAAAHGVLLGEASWVLEDNDAMNKGAKLMNADRYKTYRVYDVAI